MFSSGCLQCLFLLSCENRETGAPKTVYESVGEFTAAEVVHHFIAPTSRLYLVGKVIWWEAGYMTGEGAGGLRIVTRNSRCSSGKSPSMLSKKSTLKQQLYCPGKSSAEGRNELWVPSRLVLKKFFDISWLKIRGNSCALSAQTSSKADVKFWN